jgi:hypothetical protein
VTFLPPAFFLLFLLLPGHPLSLVRGLPWGPLALGCVVALGIGLYAAWPLRGSRWLQPIALVVLVLATAKLVLAITAPQYGLQASYYANERLRGEPERSSAFRGTPYTRLDNVLEFGGDEFPLYFLNDSRRFNLSGDQRLDRKEELVWSAHWRGFLNLPEDGPLTIWLTASGPGELSLDGKRLLRVDADGRATTQATVELSRGPHALEIEYVRKKERSALLRVDSDQGRRRPLAPPLVTARPETPERLALDRAAALVARGVDLAFLALLAGYLALTLTARLRAPLAAGVPRLARFERPLLALIPLAFFIQAVLPRLDRVDKMFFLGGGQDWLTYETLAREILINGPLMTFGAPLGQGEPFFNQPFYAYWLALLHLFAGEDLFGVLALQMLGLGVAVVLVYQLARRLFGRPTALVALALMGGVLVPFELEWVARRLLSESLYYWLMPAAVLALLVLVGSTERPASPSLGVAALAGLLLGLACLTRNSTLLYLPLAAILLWQALRKRELSRPTAARTLAVVLIASGLTIGLMPLRNWIVSGRPVLATSAGGVNLQRMHRPSDAVSLRNIDQDPLQRAIDVDRPTRETLEYLRQDPAGYFGSYLPLAAFTLGIGSAINHLVDEQPIQLRPWLLVLNALYLLAILLAPRARGVESGLLHAFIAIHFLTMVVFAPYDYENRLVTPMYLFVTVIAAAGAVVLVIPLAQRRAASRPQQPTRLPARDGRTIRPLPADPIETPG